MIQNRCFVRHATTRAFRWLPAVALVALATGGDALAGDPGADCQKTIAKSLQGCVGKLGKIEAKCYSSTGASCGDADAKVVALRDKTLEKIAKKCDSPATLTAAGYGANLTPASLGERTVEICEQNARALLARSLGGPHAKALNEGSSSVDKCLLGAHKIAAKLLSSVAKAQTKCILGELKGKPCDTAALAAATSALRTKSFEKIPSKCPGGPLRLVNEVGLDNLPFLDRALAQVDCLTAAAHPDPSPLAPHCGPRATLPAVTRGAWTQVVLDSAEFGTGCGDGSDYAFSVRLAPDGFRADRVVVRMQGGGVCLGNDCCSRPADLFEALTDHPPENSGMLSTNDAVNPFANWTLVALPYCNQDVFAGGGGTTVHNTCSVFRNGAVNVRRSMEVVRDLVWQAMDADASEASQQGYAPDEVLLMFGGHSAGAYGALYNYHWVLDDLQWERSTAWPDAGLALDAGGLASIGTFGSFVFNNTPGYEWDAKPMAAPYCFANNCGVGNVVMAANSPRLKTELGQAYMVLSNQVDSTQVSTQFFSSTAGWVNAARQEYCDTKGLPGVHWFLPARSASVHVITPDNDRFTGVDADMVLGGTTMAEWLEGIQLDPLAVPDLTEEGTIQVDVPGVNAFPCAIP